MGALVCWPAVVEAASAVLRLFRACHQRYWPCGMSSEDTVSVTVGVLALQGAFHEHISRFSSLNASAKGFHVRPITVRRPDQLAQCHALVIPGGESTAIALGLRNAGLTEPVRDWIRQGRPVWGTCAGMILLASIATGGKRGGQELLGGMDVQVGRNGFGSQVYSFECDLLCPAIGDKLFPGVFIRAPIVERLLKDAAVDDALHVPQGVMVSYCTPDMRGSNPHPVEPIAWLPASEPHDASDSKNAASHVVALRQGHLFATSFHPELTTDTRLHSYFVREIVIPSRS